MSAHWAAVATLALLQAAAPPGASVSPSGCLAGLALAAENGAPIAGATVYAVGPATRRLTTARTGTDGRWRLCDLPQGVYRVIVRAPGFAPAWVEQGGPPEVQEGDGESGPGIRVAPEGGRDDLRARLVRSGSISGRVTTTAGVPVPDVVVTSAGAPALGVPRIGQVLTGRDGRYRLEEVAAGDRLVVVLPNRLPSSRAPDRGWSRFYHPGTTRRKEARTVRVRAGAHVGDVDIVVSLPSAHLVTGRLAVPDAAEDVQVRLLSNAGLSLRTLSYTGNGITGPDIVEAGRYVVWARGRSGRRTLAAWQVVDIAGDGALPAMSLVATGTVLGHVRTESGAMVPPGDLTIGSVLWIDGSGFEIIGEHEAQVSADGSFELSAILGPRVLYVRGLPRGWDIVDIRVAGASVLTSGIDVGSARIIDGVEVIVGPGRPSARARAGKLGYRGGAALGHERVRRDGEG
ncbi:MAG: carboxypeptidase regulatory-like domain-containing protein [Vicinamibacterales bacterium]